MPRGLEGIADLVQQECTGLGMPEHEELQSVRTLLHGIADGVEEHWILITRQNRLNETTTSVGVILDRIEEVGETRETSRSHS